MSIGIRTPDQRVRVFISSTIQELAEERKAVREAIEKLHLIPVFFEAGARPHPPRDLYRAYLEQSHIFVGIYWNRYGWIASDMEISGLEDEFQLSGDKPRLIYVKNSVEGREPRLTSLLAEIENSGASCYQKFSTAEELNNLLTNDLALLLSESFQLKEEEKESLNFENRNPLPVFQGSLIGREADVMAISQLLLRPDVPVVTLTGTGGTGKTSLGIFLANQLKDRFADGVYFVPLATVSNPQSLIPTIANQIGLFDGGKQSLKETLWRYLYDKHTLLVLDNFEQIISAGLELSELINHCKHLRILVTSRAPLHIRGEHNYAVQPLAVPEPSMDMHTGDILASPAVELFIRRAREVNSQFTVDDINLSVIAHICRKLDGIPLAIELAAARTKLLSPVALLARMEKMLDTLTGGQQDLPERQKTLRATIGWSHDLLDETCKTIFKRLSVFNGSWTLSAAEQIINWESIDLLQVFEKLIDLGLLRFVLGQDQPVFTMFETVKEYAREQLLRSGEEEKLHELHTSYYIQFVEKANQYSWIPQRNEWFAKIDNEFQNIREAFYNAIAQSDYAKAWTIFQALGFYFATSGKITESIQWIEMAHITADEPVASPIRSVIEPLIQANAFRAAGMIHFFSSVFPWAVNNLKEALRIYLEEGNELEAGRALSYYGLAGISAGDMQAGTFLKQGMEYGEKHKDIFTIVLSSSFLSEILVATGHIEEARTLLVSAVNLSKQHNDKLLTSLTLGQQANVELNSKNYEEAENLYAESLSFEKQTSVGGLLGWFEMGMSICLLKRNVTAEAEKYLTKGMNSGRAVGDIAIILSAFLGYALFAQYAGNIPRMARLVGAAEVLLKLSGFTLWTVNRRIYEELTESLALESDQDMVEQQKQMGANYKLEEAIAYASEK